MSHARPPAASRGPTRRKKRATTSDRVNIRGPTATDASMGIAPLRRVSSRCVRRVEQRGREGAPTPVLGPPGVALTAARPPSPFAASLAWAALVFAGCGDGEPRAEPTLAEAPAESQMASLPLLGAPPSPAGAACSSAGACASGFCVDGVCCDNACGGGTLDDCQSCSVAAGAATNGVCGPRAAGGVCRGLAGFCDAPETCDGTSLQCPQNVFKPAGTMCRNSNGTCDIEEKCTGSSPQCPSDQVRPAGAVCRSSSGFCDAPEVCSGVSPQCPADVYQPAGTVCRNSNGFCDIVETCTGTSTLCPPDKIKPAGTMCRNPNGICDASELCNGVSPQCPFDNYQPAAVLCRNSNGFCDAVETCTGTSTQCPPDTFKPAGTMCRNANGICDADETCTGASTQCPADKVKPAGVVCRNSNGACDIVETCTGASTQCPADTVKPAGTVCRAPLAACDPAETCSGSAATCPPDAPAASPDCCPVPPACDPDLTISSSSAALVVTRQNAQHATFLDASFKLSTVLTAILGHSDAPGQTATDLYRRIWDTQRTAATAAFTEPFAPHCNDAGSTLNGFPLDCPRTEGNLATGNPDTQFRPIALFNRFDLAPVDGSHCGEYRIIFGMQGVPGRVLLILEAQLPNPTPECGLESCRPVAELWQSLPALSAASLGAKLQSFYFDGLPGFRPVFHPESYGFSGGAGPGGGQIRVNMFHSDINWQLREFHLDRGCNAGTCRMFARPVTDKNNPFGTLFNSTSALPLADDFREEFLEHVPGLAASTVMGVTMNIPDTFNTGQSTSFNFGAPDNYPSAFSAGGGNGSVFGQQIQAKLTAIGSTLTPANIVTRALSQSCAGCHELAAALPIGGGLTFPNSLTFVHVSESGALSSALTGTFLPHRAAVLADFLQACSAPSPPQLAALMSLADPDADADDAPVPTLGGSVTH